MTSSAPRSCVWPPARRTSFQAWSTRFASAIVSMSDAMQPSRIVEMPAVTNPVMYSTCEPIQNHASGCGPKRLRHSSASSARRPPASSAVAALTALAAAHRSRRGCARARCPGGAR